MAEFKLSWAQIECTRCGAARVRGVVCSECGQSPDPREVDPARQKRQRWSNDLLSMLDAPAGVPSATIAIPSEVWHQLGSWLEGYLEALARAIEDNSNLPELRDSVAEFIGWRGAVRSAQRLRPWVAVWHAMDEVMAALETVCRRFLETAGAETPLAAQRAAAAGQRAIDSAAAAASHLNEKLDRWNRITAAEDPEKALPMWVLSALEAAGVADPLSLDQSGHALFQQVTGSTGLIPTGVGVGLRLTHVQAELILDADGLWRSCRSTFHALMERRPRLREILTDPTVIADLSEAMVTGYDAAVALHAVVATARRTRQEVRALMAFGHSLIEGPGRRLLAITCAVTTRRPYDQLRRADSASLAQMTRQAGLSQIVGGFDRAIRVAKAHEDYSILERDELITIVLSSGPGEVRMTLEVFVDRILAGLEAVLALQTVITCCQAALGLESASGDVFSTLGLETNTMLGTLLGLAGWTNVTGRIDGPTLSIAGHGVLTPKSFNLAAMLIPYLPHDVQHLQIETVTSAGRHIIEGPTAELHQWMRSSDGFTRGILFVEAGIAWRLDGEPLLSRNQVRKWSAVSCAQLLEEPFAARAGRLKQLLRFATRISDAELTESIRAVMAQSRNQALGVGGQPLLQEKVERLARWLHLDVPVAFDGNERVRA